MRRILLIATMVFSLWPIAGVAAWIALVEPPEEETARSAASTSPSSSSSSADSDEGSSTGSTAGPDEGDRDTARREIEDLQDEMTEMTDRVHSMQIKEGEAKPGLEVEADYLAEELEDWLDVYGSLVNRQEHQIIESMKQLARALEEMAGNPTEATFDRYNEAISEYNRLLKTVDG